jgi:hypothetical protein
LFVAFVAPTQDFLRFAKDYGLLNTHVTHHDITRLFISIQKDAATQAAAAQAQAAQAQAGASSAGSGGFGLSDPTLVVGSSSALDVKSPAGPMTSGAAALAASAAAAAAVAAGGRPSIDAANLAQELKASIAAAIGTPTNADGSPVRDSLSYREFLEFLAAAACFVVRNPFLVLWDRIDKFFTMIKTVPLPPRNFRA